MKQTIVLLCLTLLLVPGHVKTVLDGDTFKLYSIGVPAEERVRLLGVDTPERGQPRFDEARDFTTHWLSRGPFTLTVCTRDGFGRLLGTLTRNGDDLSQGLIGAGFTAR